MVGRWAEAAQGRSQGVCARELSPPSPSWTVMWPCLPPFPSFPQPLAAHPVPYASRHVHLLELTSQLTSV